MRRTLTRHDLRDIRLNLGLTQRELAAVLNLAPKNGAGTVRYYESGKIQPSGPVRLIYQELQGGWRPMTWREPTGRLHRARARYFNHVTLNTGHSRRSYRHEVGDQAIEALGPILRDLLSGGRPTIPHVPTPCTLTGLQHRQCFLVTVFGPPHGADEVPILTLGVGLEPHCAQEIWTELHKHPITPLTTSAAEPPKTPWLAAKVEVGGAQYLETMDWLGDFGRCLAWAWIEN